MPSGAAAKLRVDEIRMQKISVEEASKGSKADVERRMITPWCGRFRGLESIIYASPCLIKLLCAGLYHAERLVDLPRRKFTVI